MSEQSPFEAHPNTSPEHLRTEAIGARILGEIDPRLLSQEQFEQSPDVLFHGSAQEVKFSPDFDYTSHDYLRDNDGSATLGFGFYAIANRTEAENYSLVRQADKEAQPKVTSILPHEARVLDLRQEGDVTKNAPIPNELALQWKDTYRAYLDTRPPREESSMTGEILNSLEQKYAEYLDQVVELEKVDLRQLLGTAPLRLEKAKSPNHGSPPWATLFSDFMVAEGYDGLIYNEGGEGKDGQGGASYVFYNLEKIGTYESWQEEGMSSIE